MLFNFNLLTTSFNMFCVFIVTGVDRYFTFLPILFSIKNFDYKNITLHTFVKLCLSYRTLSLHYRKFRAFMLFSSLSAKLSPELERTVSDPSGDEFAQFEESLNAVP